MLLWVGVPQWLSQICAGAAQDLGRFMGELLNTVFTAIAPPELEAIRLLEREQRNQNLEVIPVRASFSSPPQINLNAAEIRHVGEANVVYNNIHSHCPSCHKGNRGEIGCRLAYGRPCAGCVNPREIRLIPVFDQTTHNVITVPRGFRLPNEQMQQYILNTRELMKRVLLMIIYLSYLRQGLMIV